MKSVLLLSVFLLSLAGHSQTPSLNSSREDSSVSCIANWKVGETKIYYIVHEKNTINPAAKTPPFKFVYEAWVSVIDSTAKYYTIKWVYHLPVPAIISRPALADSLPVYNGMEMIFRVTDVGEFIGLQNWEEVRDTYIRQLDLPRSPKKLDSAAAAGLQTAKNMMNSKEAVESYMIQEIRLFHLPYGYKFATNKGVKTEIENPFGGNSLPGIQTTTITNQDPKKGRFTVSFNLQLDKVNTKSMFDSLFKKLNIKDDDQEMRKGREKFANFDMHDFSEYTFMGASGWITRLYYKRSVDIAGTTQSDAYTISMKQ